MSRFEFNQKERADLRNRLSLPRCDAKQIGQFLDGAQSNIDEWLKDWPAKSCPPLGKRRDSLDKLASQIHKTRMMIEMLPEQLDSLLWINFRGRNPPESSGRKADGRGVSPREWNALRNQTMEFLFDLQLTAADLRTQIGGFRGGVDALRKVTLVKELATSYFFAFGRRPATTPDGEFFGVAKEIENVLNGRGFPMRIGKGVVGAAIKECSLLFGLAKRKGGKS